LTLVALRRALEGCDLAGAKIFGENRRSSANYGTQ
jgi:hypothetical protein